MTPSSNRPIACGAWVRFATTNAMSGRRMPTNTTSPSAISRAAWATITSAGEYGIDGPTAATPRTLVADLGRGDAGLPQPRPAIAELLEIGRMVGEPGHPLRDPAFGASGLAGRTVVLVEERMIAGVAALERRGMASAGRGHDGRDLGARADGPVRIPRDDRTVDDLVREDDHPLRREGRLLRHAPWPPLLGVAVRVGALAGDDRDVWRERGDQQHR